MRSGQVFAGAVQPIRASVPISVERGTLKVRQTDALLAPPFSAAVIRSRVSVSIIGGRPPWRPRRFAAASPAITRSRVSARSYCASVPKKGEQQIAVWRGRIHLLGQRPERDTARLQIGDDRQ
jgi:hypothetical protein